MNLAIWLERTALKHPNREALFLGSDLSSYVSGQVIPVCGAMLT